MSHWWQRCFFMLKEEPDTDDNSVQEEIKATVMASGGKVVRPPDFDGSDNVRRFIHKFEQCAKVNGWTDEAVQLGQLSVSLSGKAYDFYMHLPTERKNSFVELRKALMAEFDSPGLQSDYALQLSSCRRRAGQSTAEFLHELQELAERAYPDLSAELRRGIVKAQFINGLDGDLRTQLMLQAPEDESMEDLERRTRRIEQVRGGSSTYASTVGRIEAGPTVTQQLAELRDQVSAVTASLAELQAGVGRLTFASGQRGARDRGVYRGGARGGGRGGRGGPSPTGDVCYRCGVSGHFARDCGAVQTGVGGACYRCGQPGHFARNCRATRGFQ